MDSIKRAMICNDAFHRKLGELIQTIEGEFPMDQTLIKSTVYYGVRSVVDFRGSDDLPADDALTCFKMADEITWMVGLLTPDELQQVFPIEKTYDGEKWQTKDYFTTMEMIRQLPEGRAITETMDAFSFLLDYDNWTIRNFLVQMTCWMSAARRAQGLPTIGESFAEQFNVDAVYKQQDHSGKEYFFNPKTGATFPAEKPKKRRPKWIRLVH